MCNVQNSLRPLVAVSEYNSSIIVLFADSIASSGHTPINKIRGCPEDGESSSGKKR